MRLSTRILAFAALAVLAAPALAQPIRITALPASDVFSVRVVGDTIAAGTDTAVFVSTDGGRVWRMSSRPSRDAKGIDAVFVHNRRLFAGTFGTGVFVSDDLGTTWQAFNQGLVGGSFDSQLDVSDLELRGDLLLASTQGDGVFARNLAGTGVWQPFGAVFEPNQAIFVRDLALGGSRLLACAGANGTTFHRDPADADWTVSLLGNNRLLPDIGAESAFFTGDHWVVGTNNGVFLSAAGQEPWTPSSTRLAGMDAASFAQIGLTLFAAFDSAKTILLAQSQDGGAHWAIEQRVPGQVASQLAVHASDLLIARSDGLFIEAEPQATTTVGDGSGGVGLRFSMAGAQPVRDQARFRFELPVATRATLEVFDVTGRRAAPPVESNFPAGPNEVTVSARTLPPGVYAARLTSDHEQGSVRFVRVR